jgi:DNA-binding transcriptional LysR family regulator
MIEERMPSLIQQINLNHLRVFECVFRTRSMTLAAKELHLTQSGVSQHMRSLEDSLSVKLFDRVNQRLIPTAEAAKLHEQCAQGFSVIERSLAEIRGEAGRLAGTVRIGMPIEFGNNILLPALSGFCRAHPDVRFALRYGFATEMNELLMKGELDFAFVDAFALDRSLRIERVYDEELELCASPAYLKGVSRFKETQEGLAALDFVDYQAGEPMLEMWFKHHFKSRAGGLNVRATVMDVQGVARLILSGVGCGVLPGYLAEKLRKDGAKLRVFKGSGKALKNAISMAYLPERTFSPAVLAAREALQGAAKEAARQ